MNGDESQFYAYLWLRENGTPYYAGKGKDRRAFSGGGRRGAKPPKDPSRIIIINCANEHEAFNTEKELVRNWGRKDNRTGILYNYTDGGEGPSGRIVDAQARLRMSGLRKNISDATRRKMSESHKGLDNHQTGSHPVAWNKGKLTSPTICEKLSIAHLGQIPWNKNKLGVYTEETLQRFSEAKKGKPWTEARRRSQNARLS